MRYYVTLDRAPNALPTVVDVRELPDGRLEVRLPEQDNREISVDVVAVPGFAGLACLPGSLSIRVEGRVIDLTTEGLLPDIGVIASGHRSYVRVESERQRAAQVAKGARGGAADKVVRSPMPGRVIKVLVKPGDVVEAESPLMVVEAMKMENEIRVKAQGTVREVHVNVGATVEGGAKLITFA